MAPFDPTSIAEKDFPTEAHLPLVVLGAGSAGLAAAIAAAEAGAAVTLIDEHPVAAGLIGMDVPYTFGERVDGAVQNKARMVERIVAARPELERAMELGVDVRLGVYVWGGFVTGPTSQALPKSLLGLADDERSWLVSFDRLIVAAGARDFGLAFPGWETPGVMGVQGAWTALTLYNAFAGRRVVVLGAGAAGLSFAVAAKRAGLEVVVIDVATRPMAAPAGLSDEAARLGIETITGVAVRGVRGRLGVEAIVVGPASGTGEDEVAIVCDTIVCAIDVVPNIEMLDVLGCATAWRAGRGGYVPVLDADGRSSVAGVYAVGDCAGISDAAIVDPPRAAAAGRRVGLVAARDGGSVAELPPALREPDEHIDRDTIRRLWLRAHAIDPSLVICRCESVTLRDLVGVRPPAYLRYNERKFGGRDVRRLAGDGPISQDQVKRLTRAGMGACQGRRCREQVQVLLAMQGNQTTGEADLATYRAPLRPLPLSVLSAADEPRAMRENWSAWFGIASMWTPHWAPHSGDGEFLEARLGLSADITK
jgi:NADPH-dependent 2,4-dienoyl-CoA reductase/sulfur reductase-like enzyme